MSSRVKGPPGELSRTTWDAPAERAALVKDLTGDLVITTSPSALRPARCKDLIAVVTMAWAASFSFLFGISPGCCRPNEVPWMRATVITRTRPPPARRAASVIAAPVNGLPVEASSTPAGGNAARDGAGRQGARITTAPL